MQIKAFTLNCDRCGETHEIKLDVSTLTDDQRAGRAPLMTFECPRVAVMYRVMGFALDTRVSFVRSESFSPVKDQIIEALRSEWGAHDFDQKISRYLDLGLMLLGVPDEYYDLLWQVTSSYCCGRFYPAMTSAGALGERILNRLILKIRDHHKGSPHYRQVYRKKSILDWDFAVQVLQDWKVISREVGDALIKLKIFRNDSVHYKSPYDFQGNAKLAIVELASVVNRQFNYIQRKDILWVFDVPGEIWVKSACESDPFVREFILPNCLRLTPYCEPGADPPVRGTKCPKKPLSDRDFIDLRRARKQG